MDAFIQQVGTGPYDSQGPTKLNVLSLLCKFKGRISIRTVKEVAYILGSWKRVRQNGNDSYSSLARSSDL